MTSVGVHLVQVGVTWDPEANARQILALTTHARPGDIVVTPEGSLSGYPASGDIGELERIDPGEVEGALALLENVARARELFLWVGRLRQTASGWLNEAVELSPHGRRTYVKRNLAHVERGTFRPGVGLPVFEAGDARVGIQICRELRFPEQWISLASNGAQMVLHMNHAVGDPSMFGVWRSMLVARAHETQRWVVSANAVDAFQQCPSMVIAPSGEVAFELKPNVEEAHRMDLDLAAVRNIFLSQRVSL